MIIDKDLLQRFEAGLNPQEIEASAIPAELLGFGEISAIFRIQGDTSVAYKRMPLFSDRTAAEDFREKYYEYCDLLAEAGLSVPDSQAPIVEIPDRPAAIYISQTQLPLERFGHKLIHVLDERETKDLIERIVLEIGKVWKFNEVHRPRLELAIDGQISNWVSLKNDSQLFFIDTSTPLYRKAGVEQLDPELILQAAPSFLRWIVRWLFLDDVMNRYYDPRLVFIDVAANLYKEQRPELIGLAIEIINRHLPDGVEPVTVEQVQKYYREDKLIWSLFLALRRLDRWITTKLLGKRYEFILPGRIKR
jgi:hypothetical protein